MDRPNLGKGFPTPFLPKDSSVGLCRLADLSRFAGEVRMRGRSARDFGDGEVLGSSAELKSLMEWACRVPGGVVAPQMNCSKTWPLSQ